MRIKKSFGMEAAMIRNTSTKLELSEEDLKLFNLLARYSEYNTETELPLDYLKKEMRQDDIDLNNLVRLFQNMQDLGVISKYEFGDVHPFVRISSKYVEAVKARLHQAICPKCRNQTLIEKTVLYCPSCKHQYDKNKGQQTPHTCITESFRDALRRIFHL
jgi:hypothetical protein